MLISAIICSARSGELLRRAIRSLQNQTLGASQYEIIVVDNHSNGISRELVEDLRPKSDVVLRYMREPRDGVAFARNLGLQEAAAPLIVQIDDDAEADPNLLESYLAAQAQFPDAVAFAGRVLGNWEAPPPDWWDEHFRRTVSVVSWGDEAKLIKMPEFICGANCAISKKASLEIGGFDPALGPSSRYRYGAEETELQVRFENAGLPIVYYPQAVVWHFIPSERLSHSYYLKLSHYGGRSQYLVDSKHESVQKRIRKMAFLAMRTPRSIFLALIKTFQRHEEETLIRVGQLTYAAGYYYQALRGRRDR